MLNSVAKYDNIINVVRNTTKTTREGKWKVNYYINGEKVVKYHFEDVLLEVISEHFEEEFDNVLDNEHPEIELVGIKFNTSYVLKTLDPIAYRASFNDYIDSIYQDVMYELEKGQEQEIDEMFFEIKE